MQRKRFVSLVCLLLAGSASAQLSSLVFHTHAAVASTPSHVAFHTCVRHAREQFGNRLLLIESRYQVERLAGRRHVRVHAVLEGPGRVYVDCEVSGNGRRLHDALIGRLSD